MNIESINQFLDFDQRLKSWPSKRKLKDIALKFFVEKFESGKIYTEKEVNSIIDSWSTFGDPALIRRELYEAKLFDRTPDGKMYWKMLPKQIG